MKEKALVNMYWLCQAVQHGSFAAASTHNRISAATLSRAVAQLEEQVGEKLLYRNAKTFQLTSSGERCYQRFAPLFEQLDEAWEGLASQQPVLRGDITVSCPEAFADFFLQPVIMAFMADHPQVNIAIRFAPDAGRFLDDQIDLAIVNRPTSIPYLIQRQLFSVDMALVASPGYLAARGRPVTVRDLDDHSRLVSNTGIPWTFVEDGETVSVTRPPRYAVNSLRLGLQAAEAGAGICLLPYGMVADRIAGQTLEQVLAGVVCPQGSAYIVWPDRKLIPARVAAFRDQLLDAMQNPADFLQAMAP